MRWPRKSMGIIVLLRNRFSPFNLDISIISKNLALKVPHSFFLLSFLSVLNIIFPLLPVFEPLRMEKFMLRRKQIPFLCFLCWTVVSLSIPEAISWFLSLEVVMSSLSFVVVTSEDGVGEHSTLCLDISESGLLVNVGPGCLVGINFSSYWALSSLVARIALGPISFNRWSWCWRIISLIRCSRSSRRSIDIWCVHFVVPLRVFWCVEGHINKK